MKKALSILMSILIIALSFTFIAGAADVCPECASKEHKDEKCFCCLECPNIDTALLVACIRDGNTVKKDAEGNIPFCCGSCEGWYPCECCECCIKAVSDSENSGNNQILTPEQQDQVVSGFQAVMARLREFFDKLFDAIFEFLRFDEIMGNN